MNHQLLSVAIEYLSRAYSPYSNYQVGAAVKTSDGSIFGGCNIENAAYGLTICAERVAMYKAISEGYKELVEMVVVIDDLQLPSPCGACRQVMVELAPEAKIFLATTNGQYDEYTVKELLPDAFSSDRLGKK